MSQSKVVFLQATTSEQKFQKIYQAIQTHFCKKEPFFILSPNNETSEFLDKLLWRFPQNSFLPHKISIDPCTDLVVISTVNLNLNKAEAVLNLCPEALSWADSIKVIYELESPEKLENVKQKFQIYRQRNLSISSM